MKNKKVSVSGSFVGYSFKEFLKGTWTTFKPMLIAGLLIGAYFVVPSSVTEELRLLIAGLWGVFSTWFVSGVEFWIKDVEL